MNSDFIETKCHVCKKELCILNSGQYIYKMQRKGHGKIYYFCGWSCMQKARDGLEQKKKGAVWQWG